MTASVLDQVADYAPRPVRSRGHRVATRLNNAIVYVLLIAVSVGALVPFVWLIRSSLMETAQIFSYPPEWIPDPVAWENYTGAMAAQPFALYFLNTLVIIALVVPGVLLSTSAAAFAFSRLQWRGRRVIFAAVLSSMLLPWAVTLVPTFIMWQTLGLTDSIAPLTIPAFFAAGAGYNIFLLRQFFSQIPLELDQAMYVDGGNPWTVYSHVILPLNKGPLTLVAIFTVIATWNDLLGPLIYLNSPEKFTMSLGLAAFRGLYSSQWGYLMAASVITILPIVVLFFFAQRYIVEGVALTGLKG
jgi:multiple sugar transport system permease protein